MQVFYGWAARFTAACPALDITTCHTYAVNYAFKWQCTNATCAPALHAAGIWQPRCCHELSPCVDAQWASVHLSGGAAGRLRQLSPPIAISSALEWRRCGKVYGRHSNSLDVEKKCCGVCRGRLEPLGRFNADGTPAKTRAASAYSLFVKARSLVVLFNLRRLFVIEGLGPLQPVLQGAMLRSMPSLPLCINKHAVAPAYACLWIETYLWRGRTRCAGQLRGGKGSSGAADAA